MAEHNDTIWIISPLKGIDLGDQPEVLLADGFALMRANQRLNGAREELKLLLSSVQIHNLSKVLWFFTSRIPQSTLNAVDVPKSIELFQDAFMAFQVVKPIETYGLIFHGVERMGSSLRWQGIDDRHWPMMAGMWAQLRAFDDPLLQEAQGILSRVRDVMKGSEISKRNAIHLLQLALEHPHPYVACLLAVMGMEAILDSRDRRDFEGKLCDMLGASALAFPDWNSPEFPALKYTVKDLAMHLYTLRSKIAHGADLTRAAKDKNAPVDLHQFKEYIVAEGSELESEPIRYATLLGEAAIYLLGQVIRKVL